MLIIDTRELRVDSNGDPIPGIYDELKRFDVPICTAAMESGDCVFEGHGENAEGKPCTVTIGCERKRLGLERGRLSTDLIQSMQDRRLSGLQLSRMASSYDYVYLFIEGMWRSDAMGEIEVSEDGRWWKPLYSNGGHGKHRVSHRQVMSYITTLELKGHTTAGNRFAIRRTNNMKETASQYSDLWHWWQKPWAQHTSHQQVYAPGPEMQAGKRGGKAAFVDPVEVFRRQYGEQAVMAWKFAAQLPGIDTVKAQRLAVHFRTPQRMCCAGPSEWMRVEGIGPRISEAAARLLREQKDVAK